jgi:hypothetical protein
MAHYAKIGSEGIVEDIIVIDDINCLDSNGNEIESIGATFCQELFGGTWVKTSYNSFGGVHNTGKDPLRGSYAKLGDTYDSSREAFISNKEDYYESWVLNEESFQWEAPVTYPVPEGIHTFIQFYWNEGDLKWEVNPTDFEVRKKWELEDSDWRVLPDYPGSDQDEWVTYRQVVRDLAIIDITSLASFPTAPLSY